MSSIIEGYIYDIFISYRQKDNKADHWVTEFVSSLKDELESTFKEEISVYFDINPHDGLLEVHDVDASLREKMKCLVFIPIISRTYCDPKSFAWENEFKAFVDFASGDHFGLKVKLASGNVTSRVLPVRIYDLEEGDIKMCEKVLGGALRGVDFVYAEPGVNRPLKPDDNESLNLNKTKYRNQINKVGNAIKDIISALESVPLKHVDGDKSSKVPAVTAFEEAKNEKSTNSPRSQKARILSAIPLIVVILVAAILLYPRIFRQNRLDDIRSSGEKIVIAVLPFQNMTNDTTWNVWQDGIQDNMIHTLSNSEELKVRQTKSISELLKSKGYTNYAAITPSVASTISRNLDANVFIYGSIKLSGNTLRLNSQLIDSKSDDVFKSFQAEGPSGKILSLIDSLSRLVRDFLIISKIEKENPIEGRVTISTPTYSPEAYRYYLYGQQAFLRNDNSSAANNYLKALSLDSNFIDAAMMLPFAVRNQGNELVPEAKKLCLRLYSKRNQASFVQKIYIDWVYSVFFETPRESINYLNQILELDDQDPSIQEGMTINYLRLHEYDKATYGSEKALEIYKKWGVKPPVSWTYTNLGSAYHNTGQYLKEKKLYKEAELDFPDDLGLIRRQAILSLSTDDSSRARGYIEKYIRICNDYQLPETTIKSYLGMIYSEGGKFDKAKEHYEQALSLDPENPALLNQLAYLLIDKDLDFNRGLELADKALELDPGNYLYLDTKSWGLFKQGKYQEAFKMIQKCDSLKLLWNYDIEHHLETIKKAMIRINGN